MVVIKKIGEESIEMEERKDTIYTIDHTMVCIVFLIGSFTVGFLIGLATLKDVIGGIFFGSLIGLIGLASIMSLFLAFHIGEKIVPVYRIFIRHRNIVITIPKTDNEEVDQTAICKAAKELEKKAWEFDNHRQKLERLARKCQ